MSLFGRRIPPPDKEPAVQVRLTDHEAHNFYLNEKNKPEYEKVQQQDYLKSLFDVGIFRDTIAPNFAIHSSLSVIAWGIGRATNRVETKDWLCKALSCTA